MLIKRNTRNITQKYTSLYNTYHTYVWIVAKTCLTQNRKILRNKKMTLSANDLVPVCHTVIYNYSLAVLYSARAALDLLLGNPAGAGCCRICKSNLARAGAGFHNKISHQ